MAKVDSGEEILPKASTPSRVHCTKRYRQRDDRWICDKNQV